MVQFFLVFYEITHLYSYYLYYIHLHLDPQLQLKYQIYLITLNFFFFIESINTAVKRRFLYGQINIVFLFNTRILFYGIVLYLIGPWRRVINLCHERISDCFRFKECCWLISLSPWSLMIILTWPRGILLQLRATKTNLIGSKVP